MTGRGPQLPIGYPPRPSCVASHFPVSGPRGTHLEEPSLRPVFFWSASQAHAATLLRVSCTISIQVLDSKPAI
jgi:hypothetical protein